MSLEGLSLVIGAVAALLAALPGLLLALHQIRKAKNEQAEASERVLKILEGNGEGRVDEMLEAMLKRQAQMDARQERMDERDNLTDQRLGRLETRVNGISLHQRQDRESLDNIQDTVVAVKKASARQLQRIAELERELARVVPVRDDLPPTDVDEEVDDVDVDEEVDDIPTDDEGLPPAGAGGG